MIRSVQTFCKVLIMAGILLNGVVGASATTRIESVALTVANPLSADLCAAPITSGVPIPRGELKSVENVRLLREGREMPAQFRAAGRWRPDGSIRWLLVDFQTDIRAGEKQDYALEYGEGVERLARPEVAIRIVREEEAYTVDTGAATFRISRTEFTLFDEVRLANGKVAVSRPAAGPQQRGAVLRGVEPTVTRAIPAPTNRGNSHLIYIRNLSGRGQEDYRLRFVTDGDYEVVSDGTGMVGRGSFRRDFKSDDGQIAIPADAWLNEARPREGDAYTFRVVGGGEEIWSEGIFETAIVESGPLRSVLRVRGSFGPTAAPLLELTAWYHFYAGSSQVKLSFTLENNDHGGRTDTGNADNADIGGVNCVFFDELELVLPLEMDSKAVSLIGDTGTAPVLIEGVEAAVELYQDSNGGDSWNRYQSSEFHPRPNSYVSFRGYRIFAGDVQVGEGERATGLLTLNDGESGLYIGVADFWQNFPKALTATSEGVVKIGLFPGRYRGNFPLRSGEHKTHDLLFGFYQGKIQDEELEAVAARFSRPLRSTPSPEWFAKTRALGYLYPVDEENFSQYEGFNLSTIGLFPGGRGSGSSLLSRREEFDLFGWMDYGDVPIDFESGTGQWGMKYDMDFHMAQQYVRSLNPRWFELFAVAARHAGDIDVHHQPHYPGLHFVKGGSWAHSLHKEPGHKNPNRNYNHFTKDLTFGARGTAAFYYLTGDWKAYHACLEIAENALARYMSPQQEPDPARENRMGWRGDACTLNRLLEGYLLSGEERYLERARWVVKDCAYDGRSTGYEPISLWSSTFYMMALARYVEMFPEEDEAKGYLLAHFETLNEACQGETCMLYTITPQADGSVVGEGTTSFYNIMGADALTLAYLLTDDLKYMVTARRCFSYGVASLNWGVENPTFVQVHSANGAMHGNLFMAVDARLGARQRDGE